MGFGERTYFQLDDSERAAPRVEFGGGAKAGTDAGIGETRPCRWSRPVRLIRPTRGENCATVSPPDSLAGAGLDSASRLRLRHGPIVGWSIRNFDVQLVINPDASLDVTETIDADFSVPKHGILREMPIRYAVGMHQYALRVRLRIVDDGEGRELRDLGLVRGKLDEDPDRQPRISWFRGAGGTGCATRLNAPSSGRATMPGRKAITRSCAGTPRAPSGRYRSTPSKVTVHLPQRSQRFRAQLRRLDRSTSTAQGKNFTKRALRPADSGVHHGAAATAGRDHGRDLDARGRCRQAWLEERVLLVAGR